MNLSEKIIRDIIRKRIIEENLSLLTEALSANDYKISDEGVEFSKIKENPSTTDKDNPVYHKLAATGAAAEKRDDGTEWCKYKDLNNNSVRGVILKSESGGPSYFIPRPFFTESAEYSKQYDKCAFLKKSSGDSEWKILSISAYKEALDAFANAVSNARKTLENELSSGNTPFDSLARLDTASGARSAGVRGTGWKVYMYQALKTIDSNDYGSVSNESRKLGLSYSGGDIGDNNASLITKSIGRSGGESESLKQAVYVRAIRKTKGEALVIPGFTKTALVGASAGGQTIGQQMLRHPPGVKQGDDLHYRKVLAKLNRPTDSADWWAGLFSDLIMGKNNTGNGYSYSDLERLSAAYSVSQNLTDMGERFSLGQRIYKSFNSNYEVSDGMPSDVDFYTNAFDDIFNKMTPDAQSKLRSGSIPLQWSKKERRIQAVNYDLVAQEYRDNLNDSIAQLKNDESDLQKLSVDGSVEAKAGVVSGTSVSTGSLSLSQAQNTTPGNTASSDRSNKIVTKTSVPSDRVLGIDMRLDISSSPGINSFDDLGYVKGSNKKIKEIIRSLISSNKESNFRGTTVRLKVYYNDRGKVYKIAFLSARDKISSIVMTKFKKELKTSLNNLSVDDFNVRGPLKSFPFQHPSASFSEIKGYEQYVYSRSRKNFVSRVVPTDTFAQKPEVRNSSDWDGEGLVMEEIPNPSRVALSALWYEHVGKKKMDEQGRKNKTFVRINFKVY